MTVVLIVILVVVAVAYGALVLVVRKKREAGASSIREALGGEDRLLAFDDKAVCKGTESGSFNNMVGMGSLGYNGDELLFQRWDPPAELRIARADIVGHTFTTELGGRQVREPLLQVSYANPDHTEGETPGQDTATWQVSDQDAWDTALKG